MQKPTQHGVYLCRNPQHEQLYDLEKDPNEQTNLANNPEYAPKLMLMKKLLSEQLDDQPGTFAEFKPTASLSGR